MKHHAQYFTSEELTETLRELTAQSPDLVRLTSLGTSTEGKNLWLLTIGKDPDVERPSVWVDGNMHGSELAGTNVALEIAFAALAMHKGENPLGLPPRILEVLREVRFFIMPQMCPDGADATLSDGRYVRSNPRNARAETGKPRWRAGDINGDGHARVMRQESAHGEFVVSARCPGLLVPRRPEDEGPFYKVYPEGTIENFDGTVPDPYFLADNDADLNRNFPYSWKPEPTQAGAGRFPTSEPESRAVVEFATAHPSIFAWLNLHTFGGVFIRPLGTAADAKMDPNDLSVYQHLERVFEAETSYPMVSGYEEFLYEKETPLYGDLSDFAYHQRGAIAYVCELWDLFKQLGIARKKPFVDHYTRMGREEFEALYHWDQSHNHKRIFTPWLPFTHAQLGHVEVGGIDIRIGITNPPYEHLPELVTKHARAFMHLACMSPRLRLSHLLTEKHGKRTRLTFRIENLGYLPTYVLHSALPISAALQLTTEAKACAIKDVDHGRRDLGHLQGYGRGEHALSLFFLRSAGSVSTRDFTLDLEAENSAASVTVTVLSPRTGPVQCSVDLG
jgi:Zinc carboxypeptidase